MRERIGIGGGVVSRQSTNDRTMMEFKNLMK
jgi:hypothetical protein